MKVSIITTCFNREKTIADSVKSVLLQNYSDIEYLIIDGASSDKSVEIIKETIVSCDDASFLVNERFITKDELKKKDAYWRDGFTILMPKNNIKIRMISEPDKGMYDAINKGILLATGDIVGLVHSDDSLYDDFVVSDYVKKFESNDYDFVYADGLFVKADNEKKIVRYWKSGSFKRWKLFCGWLPLHPTAYIKKNLFNQYGAYNETYKIAADSELMLRFFLQNDMNVGYLKGRKTIRMRMGGLSTDPKKRFQMWMEDVSVYKSYCFLFPHIVKLMKVSRKVPQFIKAYILEIFGKKNFAGFSK